MELFEIEKQAAEAARELCEIAKVELEKVKNQTGCSYYEIDIYPFWNDKAIVELEELKSIVIEDFEKLFAEGYDQIIHFTISSKLSSMVAGVASLSAKVYVPSFAKSLGASVNNTGIAPLFLTSEIILTRFCLYCSTVTPLSSFTESLWPKPIST